MLIVQLAQKTDRVNHPDLGANPRVEKVESDHSSDCGIAPEFSLSLSESADNETVVEKVSHLLHGTRK